MFRIYPATPTPANAVLLLAPLQLHTSAPHNFVLLCVSVKVAEEGGAPYTCAALHPDGLILCTGTDAAAVRIWETRTQKASHARFPSVPLTAPCLSLLFPLNCSRPFSSCRLSRPALHCLPIERAVHLFPALATAAAAVHAFFLVLTKANAAVPRKHAS